MPAVSAELRGALIFAPLLWAAASDLRSRTIPLAACVLLALAGLISFTPASLPCILLAAPFYAANRRGRGGEGDVWLVAAASFALGFWTSLSGLLVSLALFCLFFLLLRLFCGRAPETLPLAPFLAAGYAAAYFIL